MTLLRRFVALAAGGALSAGCTETGITDTRAPLASHHLAGGATTIDLDGNWTWTAAARLTFPAWVAQAIFGVEPEGPTTSAVCEIAGTMSIEQDGATFEGEMVTTESQCRTSGGQLFEATNEGVIEPVFDGQINGRSISMVRFWGNGTCEYRATIRELESGMATALQGGANCIVPGHPTNPVPLNPPPAGTEKLITWTAEKA